MRFAILSFGVVALGCGGAQTPVVARAHVPTEAEPVQAERRPYAELAAPNAEHAAEAGGVWVHLASPKSSWGKLPSLVKGLPGLALLRDLAAGGGEVLPPDIAAVIDPAQPVDLLLPLAPTSSFAPTWSLRVRSPEAVMRGAVGLTLRRAAPGVWNIGGVVDEPAEAPKADLPLDDDASEGEGESEPDEPGRTRCQLLHLPLPVDYRVVCGSSDEHLRDDAPFLVAPERAAAGSSDLHVELGGAVYRQAREKFLADRGAQASSVRSKKSTRSEQLGQHFAEALFDHDTLTFDFSLSNGQASAQLEFLYGPSSQSPRLAQWLERSSHTQVPSSFGLLPLSGGLAAGMPGVGEDLVKLVIDEIWADMDQDMEMSARDNEEALAALTAVLPGDVGLSFGAGLDADAALRALESDGARRADEADKPLSAATVEQLQAALAGWWVIGLEVAPERYLPAVERFYRATKLKSKTRPGREEKNRRDSSTLKLVPGAPAGLPKKTLHLVDVTRPEKKYVPPADGSLPPELGYDAHILVVPQGERVWIVVARSEVLAATRARALLRGDDRIGARPELGLGDARPLAALAWLETGVFQTLGMDFDSKAQRAQAREALMRLNGAPHHGKLRIPLWLDVLPRDGTPGWRLRLRSQAKLDDFLAEAFALVPPDVPTPP